MVNHRRIPMQSALHLGEEISRSGQPEQTERTGQPMAHPSSLVEFVVGDRARQERFEHVNQPIDVGSDRRRMFEVEGGQSVVELADALRLHVGTR